MNNYKISYDLGGGVCHNPAEYNGGEALTLKAPLREGYRFVGWQGSDLSAPEACVTIPAGSRGDREYTAVWEKTESADGVYKIDTTYFGRDDGLARPEKPIVPEYRLGKRGERIYKLKTVYTEINVDGEKDPAYDYGLHIKSGATDDPKYYADKDTRFDAYLTLGQDGYLYVFVEVTDPEVMVPEKLWMGRWWRCDGIHFFLNYDNSGSGLGSGWVFGGDGRISLSNIDKHVAVKTDKGYNIEFRVSCNGSPFVGNGGIGGNSVGFAVYMNDLTRFVSWDDHTKHSIMCETSLLTDGKYHLPDAAFVDAFEPSFEPASGAFEIEKKGGAEKTGDLIADMISGGMRTATVYGSNSSAYTTESIKKFNMSALSFCAPFSSCDEMIDTKGLIDAEILFCMTNRPESRALIEKTPYNGYALQILDNKIVVVGWLEKALDKAMGLLMSALEYVRNGGKTSDLCKLYTGTVEGIPGNDLPHIEGLTMVTDAGQGAYHLLCKNSSERVFREYIEKLRAAGLKTHIEHTMINTLCATLYNDDMIVTLSYGGEGDPTTHVVVDNYDYSALPPIEAEKYEPVCKTKVIQVAPNFMCYLIKLDNGEFIAVDSGNNGKESFIYDQLMKHSEDGHPVIAAWFFSHFHQDHIGGFVDFAANEEYMKNVTVKRVIHNFPEEQVVLTARGSWRDMQNVQLWQDRIARTGAQQILARTGQKFRIANAEIDTIFTYQELHPFFFTCDRTNPTSSVISVKIEGQRLIITGDTCREATKLMSEKYGEGLKTDFVQLPHHGWGDGGTHLDFYKLCDAPWVLYPGDAYGPSPAEKWACEHCKKYILREFTTKAITLPYNGEEPEIC